MPAACTNRRRMEAPVAPEAPAVAEPVVKEAKVEAAAVVEEAPKNVTPRSRRKAARRASVDKD